MPVDTPTPYPAVPYRGLWYTEEEVLAIAKRNTRVRIVVFPKARMFMGGVPEEAKDERRLCQGCGDLFYPRHPKDRRVYCSKLCLPDKGNKHRPRWSREEEDMLRAHYAIPRSDRKPTRVIAAELGRPRMAVCQKASELGLTRKRGKQA